MNNETTPEPPINQPVNQPSIYNFLQIMNKAKATDLYITVGHPACMRIEGDFENISNGPISHDQVNEILASIMTSRQLRQFENELEMNMPLHLGDMGRFRVNVLKQRQMPALVIRRIISRIPTFEELRLHPTIETLARDRQGLVLITGMTGSGKTTTMASMVDYRNAHERGHIVTIEDPIEYFHDHKQSIITQREVGVDTKEYANAIRNAFRQRPDMLLIGEILDREVMEQALLFSQTGHLCLATIHANNAYQAIDRVINLFDKDFQNQARLSLSSNLRAIVSQRLVPQINGSLIVAQEVMLNEGLIRKLIMDGKTAAIPEVMEQNKQNGMCTFDQSLLDLYQRGLIDDETAIKQSDQSGDMKIKIRQIMINNGTDNSLSQPSSLYMTEND